MLLLVILILALISVLVLSWAEEWRTELRLAANYREAHQCRRLAEAGIYYGLGKLLEAKIAETSLTRNLDAQEVAARLAGSWRGDQGTRQLKLPGGSVEVRVEDEGGKINLNQAHMDTLTMLFTALGFPLDQIRIMVDSIQDWRTKGDQPRPFGAKSSFYLKMDPPYVARNGPFETVEELAWVRGFEAGPMIPRLGEWLTVEATGQGININTAPLEALVAVGIPPDLAQLIIINRKSVPYRTFQDIAQLVTTTPGQMTQLSVQTSPFFTIKSTGMVNKKGGRQKIKAIARLDMSLPNSWEIISWVDDFPG